MNVSCLLLRHYWKSFESGGKNIELVIMQYNEMRMLSLEEVEKVVASAQANK